MDINKLMVLRHSVRNYLDKELEQEKLDKINSLISEYNKESGLHMQLFANEKKAFGGRMAHYGKFNNCFNYVAMVSKRGMDELIGYYGEKLVLEMQGMGLNSCFVALTYSKNSVKTKLDKGEKLRIVIAFGYGATNGAGINNFEWE